MPSPWLWNFKLRECSFTALQHSLGPGRWGLVWRWWSQLWAALGEAFRNAEESFANMLQYFAQTHSHQHSLPSHLACSARRPFLTTGVTSNKNTFWVTSIFIYFWKTCCINWKTCWYVGLWHESTYWSRVDIYCLVIRWYQSESKGLWRFSLVQRIK